MSPLYDLARERIQELERERDVIDAERDVIDAELSTLTEIERLAASLNGGGPVSSAQTSGRATPPGPTQPPADPPRRTRAPRSAPARKTSKTSARRAPTAASSGASGVAAPAGGDNSLSVEALLPRVEEALAKATTPLSRSAIVRELGLPDTKGTSLSRSIAAVGDALAQLQKDKRARVASTVRGGADGWARATPPAENRSQAVRTLEKSALQVAGVDEPDGLTALDQQIVTTLRELGPRTQDELAEDLAESQGDIGRAVGRLIRAGLAKSARYAGRHKNTYELTEV